MATVEPTITLTHDEGWWVTQDTETGVVSQGETTTEALDNLEEALEGSHGEGWEPTSEELREAESIPERTNRTNHFLTSFSRNGQADVLR